MGRLGNGVCKESVQGERRVELMSRDILDSTCADADAVASECTCRDTNEREKRETMSLLER
jgi:hypothetical protein